MRSMSIIDLFSTDERSLTRSHEYFANLILDNGHTFKNPEITKTILLIIVN